MNLHGCLTQISLNVSQETPLHEISTNLSLQTLEYGDEKIFLYIKKVSESLLCSLTCRTVL